MSHAPTLSQRETVEIDCRPRTRHRRCRKSATLAQRGPRVAYPILLYGEAAHPRAIRNPICATQESGATPPRAPYPILIGEELASRARASEEIYDRDGRPSLDGATDPRRPEGPM